MECAMRGDRKWRERDRTGNGKKRGEDEQRNRARVDSDIFLCQFTW